MKMYQDLKLIY